MHTWTFAFLLDVSSNRVVVEIKLARTNLTYRRIKRSRVKKKKPSSFGIIAPVPVKKNKINKRLKKKKQKVRSNFVFLF